MMLVLLCELQITKHDADALSPSLCTFMIIYQS